LKKVSKIAAVVQVSDADRKGRHVLLVGPDDVRPKNLPGRCIRLPQRYTDSAEHLVDFLRTPKKIAG